MTSLPTGLHKFFFAQAAPESSLQLYIKHGGDFRPLGSSTVEMTLLFQKFPITDGLHRPALL